MINEQLAKQLIEEGVIKPNQTPYQDSNAKNTWDVLSDERMFAHIADEVFRWGVARNITKEGGASSLSQVDKLFEEVNELLEALLKNDEEEVKDAVGDITVVVLQICRLAGFDWLDCLKGAYDEIKDRKGTMVNGVFVKECN